MGKGCEGHNSMVNMRELVQSLRALRINLIICKHLAQMVIEIHEQETCWEDARSVATGVTSLESAVIVQRIRPVPSRICDCDCVT
jgi:hypothetical protein